MSCYRRVTAWGLGFPSLLPPTSVKPLSGRPLAPLPLTLAEVQRTGTRLHGSGWMCVERTWGGGAGRTSDALLCCPGQQWMAVVPKRRSGDWWSRKYYSRKNMEILASAHLKIEWLQTLKKSNCLSHCCRSHWFWLISALAADKKEWIKIFQKDKETLFIVSSENFCICFLGFVVAPTFWNT